MPEAPRGTVTFLFSDIEHSTRLLQHLGDEYAEVLAAYRRLLREAIQAWDGYEIDTAGDGFFAVFQRATHAVAAAVAAQRALAGYSWPEGALVRVRLGLHTGEPTLTASGYVGLDVHRAARMCAAGHGGQTLLSQTTHTLVEYDLPAGCVCRSGRTPPQRLTTPRRPVPARHPRPAGRLPTSPEPRPSGPQSARAAHPAHRARAGKRRRLRAPAPPRVRLLTLTGPGGTGKTRLGLQVAADLLEDFDSGVFFVPLAAIRDAALVASTIARTLDIQEKAGRSLPDSLQESLQDKQMLLLLDNFEQVVVGGTAGGRVAGGLSALEVPGDQPGGAASEQ